MGCPIALKFDWCLSSSAAEAHDNESYDNFNSQFDVKKRPSGLKASISSGLQLILWTLFGLFHFFMTYKRI